MDNGGADVEEEDAGSDHEVTAAVSAIVSQSISSSQDASQMFSIQLVNNTLG